MLHERLTQDIIGAAMVVLNTLRPGLDERIYERALVLELTKRKHGVATQRAHPVTYDGVVIGNLIPDLIVDETVIADPKVVSEFNKSPCS